MKSELKTYIVRGTFSYECIGSSYALNTLENVDFSIKEKNKTAVLKHMIDQHIKSSTKYFVYFIESYTITEVQ